MVDVLALKRSDQYHDIANKLLVIKQGYLIRKGVQADLDNLTADSKIVQYLSDVAEADRIKVFADK